MMSICMSFQEDVLCIGVFVIWTSRLGVMHYSLPFLICPRIFVSSSLENLAKMTGIAFRKSFKGVSHVNPSQRKVKNHFSPLRDTS